MKWTRILLIIMAQILICNTIEFNMKKYLKKPISEDEYNLKIAKTTFDSRKRLLNDLKEEYKKKPTDSKLKAIEGAEKDVAQSEENVNYCTKVIENKLKKVEEAKENTKRQIDFNNNHVQATIKSNKALQEVVENNKQREERSKSFW